MENNNEEVLARTRIFKKLLSSIFWMLYFLLSLIGMVLVFVLYFLSNYNFNILIMNFIYFLNIFIIIINWILKQKSIDMESQMKKHNVFKQHLINNMTSFLNMFKKEEEKEEEKEKREEEEKNLEKNKSIIQIMISLNSSLNNVAFLILIVNTIIIIANIILFIMVTQYTLKSNLIACFIINIIAYVFYCLSNFGTFLSILITIISLTIVGGLLLISLLILFIFSPLIVIILFFGIIFLILLFIAYIYKKNEEEYGNKEENTTQSTHSVQINEAKVNNF